VILVGWVSIYFMWFFCSSHSLIKIYEILCLILIHIHKFLQNHQINLRTMSGLAENKFPLNSLLPKNETGVLNYLKKYENFNGKGCTIAIFDSGVDPKSSGLQVRKNFS
jgi:hypothetical protein